VAQITFIDPSEAKYLRTYGDNIYPQLTVDPTNHYGNAAYGESNYGAHRLTLVVRQKPKPSPLKTTARSTVRDTFKNLAILWVQLTPQEKNTWKDYKHFLNPVSTGHKAFVKINSQLQRPHIPGLPPLRSLAGPPQNPHTPTGFDVQLHTPTSQYCISWTHDYCTDVYIEAWQWTPPGRQRQSSQPFTYLAYAPASTQAIVIDAQLSDLHRRQQIHIRALNLRGEVSPFAKYIQSTKSAYRSGRYGYSPYAYSYYGP
jgi:hypothetical protein